MTDSARMKAKPASVVIPKGFARLKPSDKLAIGDRWFDPDDGKWWEFQSLNGGRTVADYAPCIVVRKITPASVLDGVRTQKRYSTKTKDGSTVNLYVHRVSPWQSVFVVLLNSDYRRLVRDYKRLLNKESK